MIRFLSLKKTQTNIAIPKIDQIENRLKFENTSRVPIGPVGILKFRAELVHCVIPS